MGKWIVPAAVKYVRARRRLYRGDATWFDVADAYNAGLCHGVEKPESAKEEVAGLKDLGMRPQARGRGRG